jgi:hypothetical protein
VDTAVPEHRDIPGIQAYRVTPDTQERAGIAPLPVTVGTQDRVSLDIQDTLVRAPPAILVILVSAVTAQRLVIPGTAPFLVTQVIQARG